MQRHIKIAMWIVMLSILCSFSFALRLQDSNGKGSINEFGYSATTAEYASEGLTPLYDFSVNNITMLIACTTTPCTGLVTLGIFSSNASGYPLLPLYNSTESFDGSIFTPGGTNIQLNFSFPNVLLESSKNYTIVAQKSGGLSSTNYFTFVSGGASTGPFDTTRKNSGVWTKDILKGLANFTLWGINSTGASSLVLNFLNQSPSDLTTTSLYSSNGAVNVSYNASNTTAIDTISINFKGGDNSTTCWKFTDGICSASSYLSKNPFLISYPNYTFRLTDNDILPAIYMYNESIMESTPHQVQQITGIADYALGTFYNVSNSKQYNIYEDMVINSSGVGGLRHYYCNSSYDLSSLIATNNNCVLFYTLGSTILFNHTHSNFSRHQVIPLSINSSGYIGNVKVTPKSYIAVRGIALTTWNVSYISNFSTAGNSRLTGNGGATWTNLSGTWDMHLHQYSGNESLCYYASGNMTDGTSANSSIRCDNYDISILPPNAPTILSPNENVYKQASGVWVNYTACTSSFGSINYYNITIFNVSGGGEVYYASFNNSLSLSYLWNTSIVPELTYKARVTCYDNNSLSSFAESNPFAIDGTPPIFSYPIPFISYTFNCSNSSYANYYLTIDSGYTGCIFTYGNGSTNIFNSAAGNNSLGNELVINGSSYTWGVFCQDDVGNQQNQSYGYAAEASCVVPPIPSNTTLITGAFTSEGTCFLNNSIAYVFGICFIIALLIAMFVINEMFWRVPFIHCALGFAVIIATLPFYACGTWIGIVMTLIGIIMFMYGIIVFMGWDGTIK